MYACTHGAYIQGGVVRTGDSFLMCEWLTNVLLATVSKKRKLTILNKDLSIKWKLLSLRQYI